MLSENQITTYKTEGLIKSSACLSADKIKELNSALEKDWEEKKDEDHGSEFPKPSNAYENFQKNLEIQIRPYLGYWK